jgi:hypothetical protein
MSQQPPSWQQPGGKQEQPQPTPPAHTDPQLGSVAAGSGPPNQGLGQRPLGSPSSPRRKRVKLIIAGAIAGIVLLISAGAFAAFRLGRHSAVTAASGWKEKWEQTPKTMEFCRGLTQAAEDGNQDQLGQVLPTAYGVEDPTIRNLGTRANTLWQNPAGDDGGVFGNLRAACDQYVLGHYRETGTP